MPKNHLVYSLLVLGILLVTAGCGQSNNSSVADVPTASLKELTTSYSTENALSMQQLDMLVMQGESTLAEAEPLITADDPKARWLAIYVIGRVSDHDSASALLPLLSDDDEIVRISAAGTLANKGYREALPILIAGVDSTNVIEYLHPQQEIGSFCNTVLNTYTSQVFSTTAEWQQWWETTGSTLKWDATQEQYL